MNDLQLVAVQEWCGSPAIARNQFAVQFNSDAVGLHFQVVEESGQGGNYAELTIFAVDHQSHSAARTRQAWRGMRPCKLLQPRALLRGFRNFQAPRLADRSERLLDVFAG